MAFPISSVFDLRPSKAFRLPPPGTVWPVLLPAIFSSFDRKGVSFLLYPASVRAVRISDEAMEELPVYPLSPGLSLQEFGEQVKGEKIEAGSEPAATVRRIGRGSSKGYRGKESNGGERAG
jgi:hypothetical protein